MSTIKVKADVRVPITSDIALNEFLRSLHVEGDFVSTADFTALESDVAEVVADLSDLADTVAAQAAEILALQSAVSTLTADLAALTAVVAGITAATPGGSTNDVQLNNGSGGFAGITGVSNADVGFFDTLGNEWALNVDNGVVTSLNMIPP